MTQCNDRIGGDLARHGAQRYAEGTRKPATCGWCGSPVWVVYHGSKHNHTLEPRTSAAALPGPEHGATDA
jgi:hypothetical protein